MHLRIEPLRRTDLGNLLEVEEEAFSSPWNRNMYLRELERLDACYLVARMGRLLVGYGGMLVILDEAHIMTLAVRDDYRRQGIATRLLLNLISEAEAKGGRFLTLEVRKSNEAAINLYKKFGFQIMGERKHYYIDNLENALIMWTEELSSPANQRLLLELRRKYGNDWKREDITWNRDVMR
jgi:ribosomal-protein-alanine N-acetyltransferase